MNCDCHDEFELRDLLREKRKEIKTFDDLVQFLQYVEDNCNYGYGEAPRSIAQAALAVAWYLASEFRITGFQAGCTMWDFIQDWFYTNNKCGMRIMDYDEMLYPQYEYKFRKTISEETFSAIQKEAAIKLENESNYASPDVLQHWKSIAEGNVPFRYTVK